MTKYVYFIQQGVNGPIKIGTALNPIDRMINLQRGSGYKLVLLGVIKGGVAAEKILHKRFGHLNIHHEWFSPGDDLKCFISESAVKIDTPHLDEGQVVKSPRKTSNKNKSLLATSLSIAQGRKTIDEFSTEIGLSSGPILSRFYSGDRELGSGNAQEIGRYAIKTRNSTLVGAVLKYTLALPLEDGKYRQWGEAILGSIETGVKYNIEEILR